MPNLPKIESGSELDWKMVTKAAKTILTKAEDSAYNAPDDINGHMSKVGDVCVAMNAISDALKLRHRDIHEMKLEECTLYNSDKAYADGYNFVKCTCSWKSEPTRIKDCARLFHTHVIQNVKS